MLGHIWHRLRRALLGFSASQRKPTRAKQCPRRRVAKVNMRYKRLRDGNVFVSFKFCGPGSIGKINNWLDLDGGIRQCNIWGVRQKGDNIITFYTHRELHWIPPRLLAGGKGAPPPPVA